MQNRRAFLTTAALAMPLGFAPQKARGRDAVLDGATEEITKIVEAAKAAQAMRATDLRAFAATSRMLGHYLKANYDAAFRAQLAASNPDDWPAGRLTLEDGRKVKAHLLKHGLSGTLVNGAALAEDLANTPFAQHLPTKASLMMADCAGIKANEILADGAMMFSCTVMIEVPEFCGIFSGVYLGWKVWGWAVGC